MFVYITFLFPLGEHETRVFIAGLTTDWKKFRSHEATSWMTALTRRLQFWQHLNYAKPAISVIECLLF
jgi:hypothetical protein